MCYVNLILARGAERFLDLAREAGASGVIIPDLPFGEAAEMRTRCDAHGLALVPLVAPTTPDERMAEIGTGARGFIYAVSLTGTTGERAALNTALGAVVSRVTSHATVPVAVGFGISGPEQAAAAVAAGAAGVIVGSRLVRIAGEAEDPAGAVREAVASLGAALR
jgi:tryptophan synthase alpha chain